MVIRGTGRSLEVVGGSEKPQLPRKPAGAALGYGFPAESGEAEAGEAGGPRGRGGRRR